VETQSWEERKSKILVHNPTAQISRLRLKKYVVGFFRVPEVYESKRTNKRLSLAELLDSEPEASQ
jgi:hypothetical protein